MSTEANKVIARRFLEEAFGRESGWVDEIIAPNQANGGPARCLGCRPGRKAPKC